MDSNFEQLNEDEKNLSYERKASAWYQAAYSLQKPDGAGRVVMLSFAWIVSDYHDRVKDFTTSMVLDEFLNLGIYGPMQGWSIGSCRLLAMFFPMLT
ncbi:hypothetical protein V6N13_094873 [Hibiscus sabdariffa]|uniref:RDRP C-terminal head domain-containing protein n=1 Tax=Hibiscus sabdariffa TaxID=183260 RepID=A0ABR2PU31_9ROSI